MYQLYSGGTKAHSGTAGTGTPDSHVHGAAGTSTPASTAGTALYTDPEIPVRRSTDLIHGISKGSTKSAIAPSRNR
eukprot:SAG31_NODE_407_length_16049_cov_46.312915_12_plen_76_part_00